MDIDAILNGGYDVRNPNYDPKTKKGRAKQPYLKSSNISDVHPFTQEGYDVNAHDAFMFNVDDVEKYTNAGINLNKWETEEDWTRQLAERQSAFKKFGNAVAQAAISEVGLGTARGVSDLFDALGGALFSGDNDYSNPVSQYLEGLQQQFKDNVAPIWVDPNKNIANGGLTDAGWWASNLPSVMSSLTLMIPSTGIIKGLGWIGKSLNAASKGKIGAFGRNAYKVMTGAGRAKSIEEAEKLNKVTRWLNDTNTMAAGQRMVETGFNAALMRTMENYQEAHQVYDDMRTKALDKFNGMSDEEYAQFINNQSDKLEGVDVNDKEAVANKLAKDAADRTFVMDYANTIFDVIELNALRNPIKLLKNMRSSASINEAQRQSLTAIGKAAAASTEATAEKAGLASTAKRFGKGVAQFLKDSKHVVMAEASEGVEEAVNYIAQEEGMHYGNVALGEDVENGFTSRLGSYMRSPELYDAAFWGVLGGVVFQGLGSGLNRLSVAAERYNQQKKKKGNDTTKEGLNYDTFQELFETSENKRRIADINKRTEDFNSLVGQLKQIEEQEIDPFNQDENGNNLKLETETEKTIAKERAISEYITGMTFRAMDNGNFDMLKAYLQDSNIRQALEEATGNEGDGGAFIDSVIRRMDNIAEKYSNNLIALSNISRNVNIASESIIPIEYLQIIARDNTAAQVKLEDLNTRIATYETSAANKVATYGNKLDQSLNYKDAVQLVVLTQQLSTLKAKKAELEKSKDKQGIGRAIELDRVNKNISIIEDMISGQGTLSNSDALTRLIYSTIQSNLINDKDSYAGNLDALMRGDIKAIIGEDNAKKFVTTDEELMKVLGADRTSGAYKTLATDIDAAFEGAYGLNKIDKRLGDDYVALAGLNIEKAYLNENIVMNEANLQKRVNELHNEMNDARTKAIDDSIKVLLDLAKKYGRDNVRQNLAKGQEINWENEADKKVYDDALEVLNLTSANNQQLYDDIQYAIKMDEFIEKSQNAANPTSSTSGESSSTSQNQNVAAKPQQPNNQSQQNGQTPTEQGNTLNTAESGQGQQGQEQNQNNKPTLSGSPTFITDTNSDLYKKGARTIDTNLNGDFEAYDASGNVVASGKMQGSEVGRLVGNAKPFAVGDIITGENYDADGNSTGTWQKTVTEIFPNGAIKVDDGTEYSPRMVREFFGLEKPFTQGAHSKIISNSRLGNATPYKPATISSTGGQESKPSPKVDEFGNPIADTNRMAIEDEITKELSTAAKNAINSKSDVIAAINAKIQELGAKYGSDEGYKKHINRMANFIAKKASKKDLTVDVANVAILASSVTERGGKYHFPEEFLKAAEKFAEDFLIAANAKEFNGKKIVSFESMLRFANAQMEDPTTAEYIYKSLKAWFEAKTDKYIVFDNMDSTSILERAGKTDRQLANERLGGTNVFRVQIDQFLTRNASKAAIDKIQKGDILNAKVDNGDIILMVGDVEIGRLPQPEVDSSTGGFKKTNNGWITDVSLSNGNVVSKLRKVWEDILTNNSTINNKINDYIYKIIAANKVNGDTKAIKDTIEKDSDLKAYFDGLKQQGIIDKKANNVELIDGLVSVWNYIDLTNPDANERAADINYSLDLWFNKLYDSYSTINNDIVVGVDKLQFTVDKITDGDVIQVAANDNEGYEKCTLGTEDKAFANVENTKLGVIKPGAVGVIQTTDNESISQPNGSTGSMWAVLPNRSGIPGIVRGHALKFLDSDTTDTPALRIRTAFANRCYELIKNLETEEQFIELYNYLKDALDNRNTNVPLFSKNNGGKFVVGYFPDEVSGNKIKIIDKSSDFEFTINLDSKQYYVIENGNASVSGYIDENTFKQNFRNKLLGNLMFNVDFRYLDSDSGSTTINGLATRDADGNFVVTIPNGTDNPTVETFQSFKHFLMQGGAARWNTKNENGSNFQPRSNNQLRNQVLNVSIENKSSRPVEENVDKSITPETINNGQAIDTLLEKRFGKNSPAVKRLQQAGLIPSQITYTSETLDKGGHPANIWTILSKKTIKVNDKFIEMAENEPDMAIRKLIHEQLHLKLYSKGNRRKELLNRIQEIYNDFEKSLSREGVDEHLKDYLFGHIAYTKYDINDPTHKYTEEELEEIARNKTRQERLEEFLVESLTNRELASYLNTVDATAADTKTKKSIFDKILELLADIFDWKVTEGSLYEKELKVLQGYAAEEIQEGEQSSEIESVTEVKETPVEETSEDDNFDEEDYEDMAASVEESTTPTLNQFVETLPLEERVEFNRLLLDGTVSMKCS